MAILTERQKRFADEYIISGNAYQSAIKAGYSENYAMARSSVLLGNGGVRAYIDERLSRIDSEKIAKSEEVLQYLTSVLRGESKASEVVVEGQGEGVSQARIISKPPDEKERLKAAELLGKRYGLYKEQLALEIDRVTIVEDLEE